MATGPYHPCGSSLRKIMTIPHSATPMAVAAKTDGHFTIIPNYLRDELMLKAGPDAFVLAYLIISWAGAGIRGARLSARYLKSLTGWGPERMRAVKATLLNAYPTVFSYQPGDQKSSRPETWWVDVDELSRLHAAYLGTLETQQAQKRGSGRPKKPVADSDTGFPEPAEKPVPDSDTGFFSNKTFNTKNLFRIPTHPCVGIQDTPVSESGTLKEKGKNISKETEDEGPPPQRAEVADFSSSLGDQAEPTQPQAPDGAAAHAAMAHTPSQQQTQPTTQGRQDEPATDTEDVPAAAAAPVAPLELVADLRPVPQAELDARPSWPRTGPEMKLLVQYGGTLVNRTITENTPVRDLPRAQWWTRLTSDEIHLAGLTASREAQRDGLNMRTMFYRALDRLIGALPATKPTQGVVSPILAADPHLKSGDGVRVDSTDGVVERVTVTHYYVQLVDETTVKLDRDVHAHLSRLQRLDYVPTLPEGRAETLATGKVWKAKKGGTLVMIQQLDGGQVTLDNGERLSILDLNRLYEPRAN